jgi:hypothetical protein
MSARIRTCPQSVSRALVLAALGLALWAVAPGAARAFDPGTQAHPGACSRTTADVATGVGDLRRNGVLGTYVKKLGIVTHGKSPAAAAEAELLVVRLAHGTTTANHGCEDGVVYPVGPRRLHKGERVAIKVPAARREHLCAGPGPRCLAARVVVHTVLPINCWNLDYGTATVVIYVRRPPPPPPPPSPPVEPEPKVAMPKATAAASCPAGGVVVTLANGAAATAPADFVVDGKAHRTVAPGKSAKVTVPIASGGSATVTVVSGGEALIDHRRFADPCPAPAPVPPAPAPVATPPAPTPPVIPVTPVNPPPEEEVVPPALPKVALNLTCGPAGESEFTITLTNPRGGPDPANFFVEVNDGGEEFTLAPGETATTPEYLYDPGEEAFIVVFLEEEVFFEEVAFCPSG